MKDVQDVSGSAGDGTAGYVLQTHLDLTLAVSAARFKWLGRGLRSLKGELGLPLVFGSVN